MNSLQPVIESRFLPFVEKPMRYVGSELNCIRKDLTKIDLHGVLCFPDLYDIGMSHFGIQILYHIVNSQPNWALSRSFHPWTDAEALMRKENIPLYTLEYFTSIKDADWIGFSVQYELQYTNIVNMIDMAGLNPFADKRGDQDPIIIAGGPCMGNPEPLAPFIDAFVIGDGERAIVDICKILERSKKEKTAKIDTLKAISQIQGVYVPSLFSIDSSSRFDVPISKGTIVRAAKIPELLDSEYPSKPLVPLMEVVHHRLAVEVMRGCTRGCRFCSAGMYYRPVRERAPQSVYEQICSGIEATGWRDVGLLSLSTADYSFLSTLLDLSISLKEQYRVNIGLPSTRVDALDEAQMKRLDAVSASSSFTIAPEAGSIRLRQVINKDFTDEVIYTTVKTLLDKNVQTLKLYFMIGLPTETWEDINSLVDMVRKIAGIVRASSGRKMVNVAISPFSPKAQTPFQWEKMEPIDLLWEKSRHIKQALKDCRNVKVSYRDPSITLLESVIARGDRKVGTLIHEAWKMGARLDGWDELFDISRWTEASKNCAVTFTNYTDEIDLGTALPWSATSTGVSTKFLLAERERAYGQLPTADCRKNPCSGCGACNGKSQMAIAELTDVTFTKKEDHKKTEKTPNQSDCIRYRFIYKKETSVRFLGHLDMVEVIHRAFITAGIPLLYSQGYHPHPRVSFGPPLPFGSIGAHECFDVEFGAKLSVDPLMINRWLPEGLKVVSCSIIDNKLPSLNASMKAGICRFTYKEPLSEDFMLECAQRVLDATVIEIKKVKNGSTTVKNIRPLIHSLQVGTDNGTLYFESKLSLAPGATCKPVELLSVLCPEFNSNDFIINRVECFFG